MLIVRKLQLEFLGHTIGKEDLENLSRTGYTGGMKSRVRLPIKDKESMKELDEKAK